MQEAAQTVAIYAKCCTKQRRQTSPLVVVSGKHCHLATLVKFSVWLLIVAMIVIVVAATIIE